MVNIKCMSAFVIRENNPVIYHDSDGNFRYKYSNSFNRLRGIHEEFFIIGY